MKSKKINLEWIYASNIILISAFLSFLLGTIVTLFVLPFPDRWFIHLMDKHMIDVGEGNFLICIFLFAPLSLLTYIALMIVTCINCYQTIFVHTNAKAFTKNNWFRTSFLILYTFLCSLIPFVLIWLLNFIAKKQDQISIENLNQKIVIKNKKIWVSTLSTLISLAIIAIPIFMICTSFYDSNKVPNRKNDLTEMYTLSENKPNTITLYFDRGYGLFWNQMLMLDYLMTHDENIPEQYRPKSSFIEDFPEFTTYVNTLSQGNVTNISNPMINGSWYQQPNFKDKNIIDPFYGENFKDITINQWFLNSYRNATGLFSKYGYENFNLFNVPYYGNRTYQMNSDGLALQNDLQQLWDNKEFYPSNSNLSYENKQAKFLSMDITEAAKSLDLKVHGNRRDTIDVLQKLAEISIIEQI